MHLKDQQHILLLKFCYQSIHIRNGRSEKFFLIAIPVGRNICCNTGVGIQALRCPNIMVKGHYFFFVFLVKAFGVSGPDHFVIVNAALLFKMLFH